MLALSVILIMSIYMTYRTYENKPKELPEEKEEIETKRKQFAMYIKEGDKYIEYHGTDGKENLFPTGYKLNTDKSRCEDINGNKIEDISFNTDTNSITVTSNKTAYCYLYFDKVTPLTKLKEQQNSGLSEGLVGGMYRYQGADTITEDKVKNYICLSEVGSNNGCGLSGTNDKLYRIIGITPEGNIKVIKQTRYGSTYQWWSNYETNKKWPNSIIFSRLNDTYYNTLDKNIQTKIEPQKWYYGDIGIDYMDSGITSEEMYQIETGQVNTKYCDPITGKEITDEKWTERTNSQPIGLMYIHDYAYAVGSEGHSTSCHTNYSTCKDSWIHMSNNGGTSSEGEWTMSRIGRAYIQNSFFYAWFVTRTDGDVHLMGTWGEASMRPVFYLTSDVKLEGEGTYSNPFYIVQ